MPDQELEVKLITEQLSHTIDNIRAENQAIQNELAHYREMVERRLNELETCQKDHEGRLRLAQETTTQFKLLAGLATGGGLLSLIALIRALLGTP
jgi:hypothetical protein